MHPADIRAALNKSGKSQTQLAEELGVSDNAISLVIHGRSKSFRIARAISKITGLSVHILWPGRYTPRRQMRKAA